ncbi:cellulase family glycosylhydrolase [Pseudomonas fulva]|uniref:cellulase family glycosylhydrolase n=1 Tax=Pseudomonas TaxID=286 RepID=UPI0019D0925C|nr:MULTISPECIES: cellulase family glycosylhydrolase [Pseudomonas]MBN6792875.1 cellulase family glycosylhydrolase [Pseudomonas fulva]MBN6797513.1 cellulase family glycosylhydrolase [Pseudomonas fulva]MBN6858496.1 cellulase family glycosylhydrolase [Pseudomonas fulva]MBN6875270.1 cellulase family glycosylhydrolase [Pseudomonas fulva]MBN6879872.1 cellulase family glycosylhydrolase [Pseudomonas fulva]
MTLSALRAVLCLTALCSLGLPTSVRSEAWQVSIDEQNGLPVVTQGGGPVMSAKFDFWAQDWSWTGFQTALSVDGPGRYTLQGLNKALDFELKAAITQVQPQTLAWDFDLDAHSRQRDVIGGGMVFQFDPAQIAGAMGAPQLLADNRGWSWGGTEQGRRVEMRFDPPLAKVYFERGNPSELRAFFYKDAIAAGKQQVKAVLNVTGDIALAPTPTERFGLVDPTAWPEDQLDWRTSPVDLSFLNARQKPAGKHGFVQARGEQLVFEDNTPVRFWGTNLSAYALFKSPDEEIAQQAKRLSALGFNLVRLHHHDSPWVSPNVFGDGTQVRGTQQLDAESMRKLDLWIKALKDEGIYIWLDLHVQRALTAQDGIDDFGELAKGQARVDLKGYAYVNASIQQAMKNFAAQYLGHVNPLTGLAYKDDPAIATILLTNENDITQHYGNALLPDKDVPRHSQRYMAAAKAFASQHDLPADLTWRAWQPGPSKLFLNDLEQRFNADMIAHLRALGVRVPIATTSTWGGNGLNALPALTVGDVIDAHSYGASGQLEKNPLTSDGLIDWLAAAQVVGKPLTVSEWNAEPFPLPDRHSLPLYIAGTASHQGWDAMLQYAYSQQAFNPGWRTADNWHAYNDPALLATMPAAALMYRRGDVQPASTRYVFAPSPETLYNQDITPRTSALLRTAVGLGQLQIALPVTPQLPWLKPAATADGATVLHDPAQALLPADATESVSDTGELKRNWQSGLYTIDTPLTQAATGWLGGRTITLGDVQVQASTPYASIAVQSLDGVVLGQSRSLLVSLGTRAVPQPEENTRFHVEPLKAQLSIKAPAGLKLFARDAQAQLKPLPASYRDGRYHITLDGTYMSNWLFLK